MPRAMSSRGRIEAVGSADWRNTLTIGRVIDFPQSRFGAPRKPERSRPRQARGILDKGDRLCYTPGLPDSGRLAQLVEQLTLNQRVVGSIPTAPTKTQQKCWVFLWP